MYSGYSGKGSGLNNPAAEDQAFVGPIPQGIYEIGPMHDSKNVGKGAMSLTPNQSNNMFGRDSFKLHGDNSKGNQSASEGCIVIPKQDIRDLISNSGDNELIVVN